jgi:hypothetical protein
VKFAIPVKHLHVAILAIVLATGSFQCSAICASAPCGNFVSQSDRHTELPPCHRHSPAKNNRTDCKHSMFVAEAGSDVRAAVAKTQTTLKVTVVFLRPRAIDSALLLQLSKAPTQETPPPGIQDLTFSSVLQI